jgi:hypothetical protein
MPIPFLELAFLFQVPAKPMLAGISSHVLSSKMRPARFFCLGRCRRHIRTPPHCLKRTGLAPEDTDRGFRSLRPGRADSFVTGHDQHFVEEGVDVRDHAHNGGQEEIYVTSDNSLPAVDRNEQIFFSPLDKTSDLQRRSPSDRG